MNKWKKEEPISCGKIMQWRASVIECQCPECKRWCLKWADTNDYEKCPHCGADMRVNTKRKGTPIEGNNESYNCENWIP